MAPLLNNLKFWQPRSIFYLLFFSFSCHLLFVMTVTIASTRVPAFLADRFPLVALLDAPSSLLRVQSRMSMGMDEKSLADPQDVLGTRYT